MTIMYHILILCILWLHYRGQDITSFLPKPDVILMADVVYYEEVNHFKHSIIIIVLAKSMVKVLKILYQ